jgi:hypothetical protein
VINWCFGILIMVCPTDQKQIVVRDYCKLHYIIHPSRKDTSATKRMIRRSNATYRKLCGRKNDTRR